MLDAKNKAIRDLQYELARVTKAHNDVIGVYNAKLAEFGIPQVAPGRSGFGEGGGVGGGAPAAAGLGYKATAVKGVAMVRLGDSAWGGGLGQGSVRSGTGGGGGWWVLAWIGGARTGEGRGTGCWRSGGSGDAWGAGMEEGSGVGREGAA